MENNALTYHLTKAFQEQEARIAERVISLLSEKGLGQTGMPAGSEMLLTDKQLCEKLQISISHLHNFKKTNPKFPMIPIGKSIRYKLSEVEEFLKSNPIKSKK